ncbi:MAG: ATP-binding protein [Gammaproteobacteria bacterium CG22_combo_CG10-13_8_21_14_all_40_8]|nr:MAG: ATP-binding protein [Gammaproteobacteria bacterium CG22_combo_CG10-13_8_21_14_all_40_8]
MTKSTVSTAPIIAIIGCDGSGKSTVCEQIAKWVTLYGDAAAVHLGKQQGNVGRTLSNLPLVGKMLGSLIARKVSSVNKAQAQNKAPIFLPALVMYAFTLRRVRRFKKMLKLRNQGFIIIADRFPQLDYPKAYDGPSFIQNALASSLVQRLIRKEYAAFEWMTSFEPDLVIRLNVDIDTACARKPDHERELLQNKINITPLLKFKNAPIVDINTVQPLVNVLADVKAAVSNTLEKKGFHSKV